MNNFIEATGSALALAPVYMLTAAGFVIVYRATQVFNFAQGAMMLLGAYFLQELAVESGLPLGVALVGAVIGMALVGALIYILTLKPLTGKDTFGLIIVTMGISIVVTGLAAIKWGFAPTSIPSPSPDIDITIGAFRLSGFDVSAIAISLLALIALGLFFRFASTGIQMRAVAESPILASRRGVSVQKIYIVTWMLAGAFAALAGAIVAFRSGAGPSIAGVGLLAFPAALIGGFDSLLGAVIGGLIVALAQTYAVLFLGAGVQEVVVFALMLAVLLVRPFGLFGGKVIERV